MFWTRFVTVNLSQCYTNQQKRRRYLGAKLSKSLFFLKNNDFEKMYFILNFDYFIFGYFRVVQYPRKVWRKSADQVLKSVPLRFLRFQHCFFGCNNGNYSDTL